MKSCTRYYSYAGKTVAQRTATGLTWLVSDTQNTASISVDSVTQQATVRHLSAYGEIRDGQAGWLNDKGFLGKTIDNTGLTHVGAREYDPGISRFVSVDALMDVTDPQMMQGYSYANNSPVSFSDPSGMTLGPVDCATGGGYACTGNEGTGSSNGASAGFGGTSTGTGTGGTSGGGGGASSTGDSNPPPKCNWWCKSKKWASDHKADIAGVVTGAVVGVGCGVAIGWTGVGAVACGALAGAAGSVVHDLVEGGHTPKEILVNAVVGGVIGGVTGGLMSVGGQALSAGVRSLVAGGGGQAARQAASGAARTEAKNIVNGLARRDGLRSLSTKPSGTGPQLPRTMACVCEIAKKYGIDISRIKIEINRGGRGYFGESFPNRRLVLTPRAFDNEEQLARTLVHEKVHLGQIAANGNRRAQSILQRDAWEDVAHGIEDAWWESVGSGLR